MQCSTCGGEQFEHEADAGPFLCVGCRRLFTREELLRENEELIHNQINDMAADFIRSAQGKLHRAFSGSKDIKFK
jgi:hypothetical protein